MNPPRNSPKPPRSKGPQKFERAGLNTWNDAKTVRGFPPGLAAAFILLVVYMAALAWTGSNKLGALFPAFFVPPTLWGGVMFARTCRWRLVSVSWPEVRGEIAGVRVKKNGSPAHARVDSPNRNETWEAEVVYVYQINGRRFRAKEAVCPSKGAFMDFDSRQEAREAVSPYRVGMPVRVRHHPDRPKLCVLVPRQGWWRDLAGAVFCFAFSAVAAAMAWVLWTFGG